MVATTLMKEILLDPSITVCIVVVPVLSGRAARGFPFFTRILWMGLHGALIR